MKAETLQLLTKTSQIYSVPLDILISIYKLGYKQQKIDGLIEQVEGINYGSEVVGAN